MSDTIEDKIKLFKQEANERYWDWDGESEKLMDVIDELLNFQKEKFKEALGEMESEQVNSQNELCKVIGRNDLRKEVLTKIGGE